MCDTIVSTFETTASGVTILGKNSDHEPNEAQHVVAIPAMDHSPKSMLKCTHIEIPQVVHTYATLLSKPFWIWGAEMGVNEHSVAIGNEAVFTKLPYEKKAGLIGMDLLRLGLERATTARQAVEVITSLLEEFGQGGNCGFTHKSVYHNSFLIADPRDAWVLETAGTEWVAQQIHGVYTISNGLTIGNQWDLASPGLVDTAITHGWCKSDKDFDFSRCYSDFLYTNLSACRTRRQRTTAVLTSQDGKTDIDQVMAALRDHGENPGINWTPAKGLTGMTVCAHASFGPVRGSQTTGSLVAYLHPDHPCFFVTGTAAPCTSIFKPVWLDAPLPETGPVPSGIFDEYALFWQHERLHRSTLRNYPSLIQLYQAERDELEKHFINQAISHAGASPEDHAAISTTAFQQASMAEQRWLDQVLAARTPTSGDWLYQIAWDRFNLAAGIPLD